MERQYRLHHLSSFGVTVQRALSIYDNGGEQHITMVNPDPLGTFTFHFISLINKSFGNPISLYGDDRLNRLWVMNDEGQCIGFITPYNAITKLKFIQTFCDVKRFDIPAESSLSKLFD